MNEKLSDWFKAGTKPELHGVYETKIEYGPYESFQYWNGRWWGMYNKTVKGAYSDKDEKSARQKPQWRGLAENPEK